MITDEERGELVVEIDARLSGNKVLALVSNRENRRIINVCKQLQTLGWVTIREARCRDCRRFFFEVKAVPGRRAIEALSPEPNWWEQ